MSYSRNQADGVAAFKASILVGQMTPDKYGNKSAGAEYEGAS